MTRVWRLCKQRYLGTAFQGEGARIYGGRWNSPGHPTVYTSETAALATLEILVHLEDTELLQHYTLVPASLDEDLIVTLDPEQLPENWRRYPAPESAQAIGDAWIADASSVGLRVPSVVIPGYNVLLNPQHPDFDRIETEEPVDWDFDPRLRSLD